MIALLIPVWFGIVPIDGGVIMGVVASSAIVIGGAGIFVRGTQAVVQSTRRLRAVHEMTQLPVARVRQLPGGSS